MEKLLARLERKLGRYAVEHLTWVLVGGAGLVFALQYAMPGKSFYGLLMLDFERILHGQVWRLVTFALLPPPPGSLFGSIIGTIFGLWMIWIFGTGLENAWGALKFNVYYLVGMLGTIAASAITYVALGGGVPFTNFYLNATLLFAFATLWPDFQILLFFILPVRIKWFAFLDAAFLIFALVTGDWATRAAIIAAVANYFLFFGGHLAAAMRGRQVVVRQAARRAQMRSEPPPEIGHRACAICGKREDDGADIRVCSCEKCGNKARNLCLEHARNH